MLDFREVRSLYGLQRGDLESCPHPLLALKLPFYPSSWEYKVWVEGNGPHQRLASVHLPTASPVLLDTWLQPYSVSVHTCLLPCPGQLVLCGLRSWVRMAGVPWSPRGTVPMRQSVVGMPCLLTLNSNLTYPPLTDLRNVRKFQGQDLKYYTMSTLEGPWEHAAHGFSVWVHGTPRVLWG